jgi:hypothetical protein
LNGWVDTGDTGAAWPPLRKDVAVDPKQAQDPNVGWEADFGSPLKRRIGKSAKELGRTKQTNGCPDIWELENGDIAVIGREGTAAYRGRLPSGVTIRHDERLVVIPRDMLIAARPDIPDA